MDVSRPRQEETISEAPTNHQRGVIEKEDNRTGYTKYIVKKFVIKIVVLWPKVIIWDWLQISSFNAFLCHFISLKLR